MGSELSPRLSYEDPRLTALLDVINPLRLTDPLEYARYIEACALEGLYYVWCVDVDALGRGITCYRLGTPNQPPWGWPLPPMNYWVERIDSEMSVAFVQEPNTKPTVLWVDPDPLTCMQKAEEDHMIFGELISTRA